ncbi:MAG: hypothetical protein GX355_02060 [Globicatella sulfidifaciens]|uniref:Thiopeptide-type bacteriocin biosynthesis domain-containing protein n=2 Tax=Globicatella sulfidifaciens TaxID=136093 RepID=A0A7X8GZF7_9LACT|nr:hypothetical protein [Globicatella sulfidifaciens]
MFYLENYEDVRIAEVEKMFENELFGSELVMRYSKRKFCPEYLRYGGSNSLNDYLKISMLESELIMELFQKQNESNRLLDTRYNIYKWHVMKILSYFDRILQNKMMNNKYNVKNGKKQNTFHKYKKDNFFDLLEISRKFNNTKWHNLQEITFRYLKSVSEDETNDLSISDIFNTVIHMFFNRIVGVNLESEKKTNEEIKILKDYSFYSKNKFF